MQVRGSSHTRSPCSRCTSALYKQQHGDDGQVAEDLAGMLAALHTALHGHTLQWSCACRAGALLTWNEVHLHLNTVTYHFSATMPARGLVQCVYNGHLNCAAPRLHVRLPRVTALLEVGSRNQAPS